jgi:hypothetical protein
MDAETWDCMVGMLIDEHRDQRRLRLALYRNMLALLDIGNYEAVRISLENMVDGLARDERPVTSEH